jgi:polygalacturonase
MPDPHFNVRDYGATGDGRTIDSPAINAAIDAAVVAGGGTVVLPAGTYASYSIRLRSHVTLQIGAGATLLAAPPPVGGAGGYDAPEPNEWGDVHRYQDFGHSHWRNSLIWGEGLEHVAILGPGRIDGRGLHHGLDQETQEVEGGANKAIGLKHSRHVLLRDLVIEHGGHFAVLATGVDHLTIDNLTIDTQRDGLDIDCCRWVSIANCRINTPNDDAIVLKSSYALGEARSTEQVTITNCIVSGFDLGTMVNGTYGRTQWTAPDGDGPTGRIKLGTESYGGFRNLTISNCVLVRSRGLAIESVDGAVIENVTVSNLVMSEIVSSPIFVRLGARLRGPAGTTVGAIRRVQIDNVVIDEADSRFAALLSGLPGHPIEELSISNLRIRYRGGLTMAQVASQPAELVSHFFQRGPDAGTGPRAPYAVPERAAAYPEPSMFGLLPAYAWYARHVRGLRMRDVRCSLMEPDERAAVVLQQVTDAVFERLEAERSPRQPLFVLREVDGFEAIRCSGIADLVREGRTTEEVR